jgi:transmembrane sensor
MSTPAFDPTDEAAAAWVSLMDRGQWSDGDEARLQSWLTADPRHAGALLEAQSLWSAFDTPISDASGAEAALTHRGLSRRRVLVGGGAAMAASIAGVLLVTRGSRYTTGIGETRRVPMADGSLAAINTDTSLEIELADRRRAVRLATGEAWFQVAKDATRPFVVEAGQVRVQAIGTAFSVRRRETGADILVTEGVVRAWADGAEGNAVQLSAGERAFVGDDAGINQKAAAPAAIDRMLAWRSGKIDLAGTPLSDAVAEFNRYNHRQIVIADPTIAAEQFDGVFGTNDPLGFATSVRDSFDVPVDVSDPGVIRVGRPPN